MQRITAQVVAALLWDQGRLLICQRPANKSRALLWEFPGGKVEKGESLEEALKREILEELGVEIHVFGEAARAEHAYPDMQIYLHLFNASIKKGTIRILEHADAVWIHPAEITGYDFCPADVAIQEKIAAGIIHSPQE